MAKPPKPLTEAEWLNATDAQLLLESVSPVTRRKLRLFAVACCRRVSAFIARDADVEEISVIERYADGNASEAEMRTVHGWCRSLVVSNAASPSPSEAAYYAAGAAASLLGSSAALETGNTAWRSAEAGEHAAQADLLRHIIGNPFRPLRTPSAWPTAIIRLAESEYRGDNVAFALSDALCECGLVEFAAHFREGVHPKGCAWLDAILGKQ